MSSRRRVTVAIVGAGKVGQSLGRLIAGAAGYEIGAVVSRTRARALRAVDFIGAGEARTLSSKLDVRADVILIATPDDAIESAASTLAASNTPSRSVVALHTSGAVSSDALRALAARGASTGSMHPLQSFSTARLGVERVPGSVFGIEGAPRAVTAASRLARAIGGRPLLLDARTKPLYHAAAVLASGHVTALIDASVRSMAAAGIPERQALEAVLPLIEGTLANIRRVGTARALTGPFARGDKGTISRNRAALAAVDPKLAEIYDALGRLSAGIVRRSRR